MGGRIRFIQAIPLSVPLKRDFGGSQYHVTRRCTILTRLETEDGLVSQVYNGDNRDHPPEVVRRLITGAAVDIVNFDASECGGVTEWRRAAGLCATFGVELAHHEEPQIAAQLLSAVPKGTYVECFADPERDPIWDHLIANRRAIRDGILQVPTGPGFGLSFDANVVECWRVDR